MLETGSGPDVVSAGWNGIKISNQPADHSIGACSTYLVTLYFINKGNNVVRKAPVPLPPSRAPSGCECKRTRSRVARDEEAR